MMRAVMAWVTIWAGMAWAEAPLTALRPQARPTTIVTPASRPGTLPPSRVDVAGLIDQAQLGPGVAIGLRDLAQGTDLVAINADQAFAPASVTKVFTALYALETLPQGYQFATDVTGSGQISDGILQGDLALIGGGDPTLDSDALDQMAQDLAALGLRGITGRFLVWGGALPYHAEVAEEQMDHLSYNPAISGLNLNFNRVHMQWRRSGGAYRFTFEARGDAVGPKVGFATGRAASRNLPIFDTDGPDQWSVAAPALGQAGARWMPVRRPALYAGETFRILAQEHGITLPEPQRVGDRPRGDLIVRHRSAPVRDIVRGMLEYSTNLTAEILGLAASQYATGQAHSIHQSAPIMVDWLQQKYGVTVDLRDHSGLEDDNRVSVRALLDLLAQPTVAAQLRPVLKQIEIADVDRYPGRTLAKTGTLNFVSTLAGYVDGFDGRPAAFAILTGDLPRREAAIATGQEVPDGAVAWNTRSKTLQEQLLRRWRLASE